MSDKSPFKLNSSLQKLRQVQQIENTVFLEQLRPLNISPSKKIETQAFRLNPSSSITISSDKMETLKQAQPVRLESLYDEPKVTEIEPKREVFDRRPQKKYHIELGGLLVNQPGQVKQTETPIQEIVDEDFENILKPSEPYRCAQSATRISTPVIFQTPSLPCFGSQFDRRQEEEQFINKVVKEKKGVWKIGKMKIKAGKCVLKIGEFEFEGIFVPNEGKSGVVHEGVLNELPDWSGMWVMQPKDDLFM